MFRSLRTPRTDRPTRRATGGIEPILGALPNDVTVYIVGGSYLVVSPTGLFALTENAIDIEAGALAAATAAQQIRDALSDQMPFVPFVDAIVATDRDNGSEQLPAVCVPLDLLRSTIVDGPTTIDSDTLEMLGILRYPRLR